MSWTTPADVQDAWIGPGTPSDAAQLQLWINRAERKIRKEVPGLSARLALPADDPAHEPDLADTVKDVVADMVERKYRNPEGVRTAQDTTGPMSGSVTFGGDHPGVLYLTAENLEDLRPPSTASGQRAFEIDLYVPPVTSTNDFGLHVNG